MSTPHPTAPDAILPPCSAGAYPWDDWERSALSGGLAADLASLGRAVMREAYNHAWCGRLKMECGWSDAGRAMLARVRQWPRRTAARWEWLLVTDGLRFDPWEHDGPRPFSENFKRELLRVARLIRRLVSNTPPRRHLRQALIDAGWSQTVL